MIKNKHIKSGFTITEVLIVGIVLSVLMALALPKFTYMIEKSKMAEGFKVLSTLLEGQRMYYMEHSEYATSYANLDVQIENNTTINFGTSGQFNLFNPIIAPLVIADITRIENGTDLYILYIDKDGLIFCDDIGMPNTDICARLGCSGVDGAEQCN